MSYTGQLNTHAYTENTDIIRGAMKQVINMNAKIKLKIEKL